MRRNYSYDPIRERWCVCLSQWLPSCFKNFTDLFVCSSINMRTAVDLRQFPSDSSSCGFRAVWLGAESISVLGTQVRRKSLTIGLLALSQHSRLRSVTTPTTTTTTRRHDDTTTRRHDDTTTQRHNSTTAQQHNATTQQHNATTTQHNNTTPQRQRLLQLPTERSNANDCHSVVSQSHSRRRTVGAHRSLPLTRSPQPTAHSPTVHNAVSFKTLQ